jgi:hypothetical protein
MNILVGILSAYSVMYLFNRINKNMGKYTYVKSDIDGQSYLVQNRYSDSKNAANTLARIRIKFDKLVSHLKKEFPDDPRTKRILERFDTKNIMENYDSSEFTSYTQNKGEKMVFCLRTRNENNELHKLNLLTFVAIHELAHVASDNLGHDSQEFWDNFAFLLENAVKIGVWKYVDFSKNPTEYCGTTTITNSII